MDREELSGKVFRLNQLGGHVVADLARESVVREVPVVVGGPPCRPWSVMNVQRRREDHAQYRLLERFFDHVEGIRPALFLMENVPSVRKDEHYGDLIRKMRAHYSVEARVVTYAEFGAATKRRRLITVGIRRGTVTASDFFRELQSEHSAAATVAQRIGWLRDIPWGGFPDHEWSQLKTIDHYEERYRSGRFGWAQLAGDEPAPSFGSVAKTYILHPEAGLDGFAKRVLSVREVLQIMGFDPDFRFPPGTSRTARYQMAADAVSPVFSRACARTVRRLLWGEEAHLPTSGLEQS